MCNSCGRSILGNEAFKSGLWKEAIEGYTRAIDIDPDNKVQIVVKSIIYTASDLLLEKRGTAAAAVAVFCLCFHPSGIRYEVPTSTLRAHVDIIWYVGMFQSCYVQLVRYI